MGRINLKQRCFKFSLDLIKFIRQMDYDFVNQILFKQIIRSGTSIGANIIEAFGSNSKKDFTRYFTIALKSANETKYWLYLIKKTSKETDGIESLINETKEIAKMIAASIMTLQGKRKK